LSDGQSTWSAEQKQAAIIQWVQDRRPVNTKRSYKGYDKQFKVWCEKNNEVYLLATPVTLARWMRELHEVRELAAGTITKSATSAVADKYRFSEHISPTASPLVSAPKKVINAIAPPRKRSIPLTAAHIGKIVESVKPTRYLDVRNIFMVILMFAAMLRSDEVVSLRPGDVWLDTYDGEEVLYVFIEKSKTDQARNGHTVVLGRAKDGTVCPIFWFKMFQIWANKEASALFHQKDSVKGLAAPTAGHVLKNLLHLTNIEQVDIKLLTSHSCRIGGATAAAAAGVNMRLIMRHGNWKSFAVFLYSHDCMADRLSVSQAIL
jgi:site-specific recombinase XerD